VISLRAKRVLAERPDDTQTVAVASGATCLAAASTSPVSLRVRFSSRAMVNLASGQY
jgi:hypothetical protein